MPEPIIGENQDQDQKLIFILALLRPDNPNMWANVAFGVSFKAVWIDEQTVEMSWVCLRQVQQNNGAVLIQTPPPAFKWLLAKDHYMGIQPFNKDDYMGPGHEYRLVWIHLPADDPGVAPGEISRIIKPNSPLLFPGR